MSACPFSSYLYISIASPFPLALAEGYEIHEPGGHILGGRENKESRELYVIPLEVVRSARAGWRLSVCTVR